MRPEIVLIAAVARNGAIGRDGELLFRDSADQRHFREATMGCPVIMGRKTWHSVPARFRPLPGRRNLVLSRDPGFQAAGAQRCATLDEALAAAAESPRVFVIGGAEVYALAFPRADTLVLTEVEADLPGDAFFPTWDRREFTEVSRRPQLSAQGQAFDFVEYRRLPRRV